MFVCLFLFPISLFSSPKWSQITIHSPPVHQLISCKYLLRERIKHKIIRMKALQKSCSRLKLMTHTFVRSGFTLDWQSRIEQSIGFLIFCHSVIISVWLGQLQSMWHRVKAAVLNCDQLRATGTSQKQLSDDSPQQTHKQATESRHWWKKKIDSKNNDVQLHLPPEETIEIHNEMLNIHVSGCMYTLKTTSPTKAEQPELFAVYCTYSLQIYQRFSYCCPKKQVINIRLCSQN